MNVPDAVVCCPTCHSTAVPGAAGVVACPTCGTRYRLPGAPVATSGRRFDPREVASSGFSLVDMEGYRLTPTAERLELRGQGDGTQYSLESRGQFTDVEVDLTAVFLEGPPALVQVGIALRRRRPGAQVLAMMAADRTFAVMRLDFPPGPAGPVVEVVPWASHPGLAGGFGVKNRLTLRARGGSWQVELNGELAASFTVPEVTHAGHVRIAHGARGHLLALAITDVALRPL